MMIAKGDLGLGGGKKFKGSSGFGILSIAVNRTDFIRYHSGTALLHNNGHT